MGGYDAAVAVRVDGRDVSLAGSGARIRTPVVCTIPQGDRGSPPFDACFDDGTFVVERFVGDVPAGGGARNVLVRRYDADRASHLTLYSIVPR